MPETDIEALIALVTHDRFAKSRDDQFDHFSGRQVTAREFTSNDDLQDLVPGEIHFGKTFG